MSDINKKLPVLNWMGTQVGEVDLPGEILSDYIDPIVIKEIVNMQRARNRSATACVKHRGEVSGSTAKRRPQKRSGRARMGSRNVVHHRGGAVAFGPNGRKYDVVLPKKKFVKAVQMLITQKIINNKFIVIDNMAMSNIGTKAFLSSMQNIGVDNAIFIDKIKDQNFFLSMRNVIGYDFLLLNGINPLSIVSRNALVISLDAMNGLKEKYAQ
jgi:large subunit ribosomal protein L4